MNEVRGVRPHAYRRAVDLPGFDSVLGHHVDRRQGLALEQALEQPLRHRRTEPRPNPTPIASAIRRRPEGA